MAISYFSLSGQTIAHNPFPLVEAVAKSIGTFSLSPEI
jgi:hypothetical protein